MSQASPIKELKAYRPPASLAQNGIGPWVLVLRVEDFKRMGVDIYAYERERERCDETFGLDLEWSLTK